MNQSPTTVSTTTTPASSSAANLEGEYEVFLSFRGKDTRHGFTDFLYTYLKNAGVHTFKDDKKLRVGEEIGPDLLKAIHGSKILIPIFSKNYAYSKWCLRELTQMVECHKNDGRIIFPIFYDVEPSDVRDQKGNYEEAFRQHEVNLDDVTHKRWKDAMTTVGKRKGWELKKETNGHEGEFVKMVVENVLLSLKKDYTLVPDYLVGMDHHISEMKSLLDLNSNGVRIVFIHGMGGIGKTTISKAIYNQLCDHFDSSCFLDDVRERSQQDNGIVVLQNELVFRISRQQSTHIINVDEGINKIKALVCKKKVLLVLDDIDSISQFEKLAGKCDCFSAGSRIVVTTRNKEVLNMLQVTCQREGRLDVYKGYKPTVMNDDHSLQLFSKYAFRQDFPPEDYKKLSKDIVSFAAGLPLVLVTVGSILLSQEDKALWEEKLRKLQKIPQKEVLDKLRISFDALGYEEQQIFLDIACLFVGKDKANPCYMWEDCGFYPRSGINTLVLRSLVQVGDDNRLRMHDQLRDLGRQIVRENFLSKPGEYSIAWHPEEALNMLQGGLGIRNVEALNLDLKEVKQDEYDQLKLLGEVYRQVEFVETEETKYMRRLVRQDFYELQRLRFLRLGHAFLDGDFQLIFSNLRWLEWRFCQRFMPTNLNMINLVILDLSNSTITDEWEGWAIFKAAKKLKVLTLLRCKGLVRGPKLCMFTTLEMLNLSHTGLTGINLSHGNLVALKALDLSYCNILKLDCSTLRNLESLNLHFCKSLLEVAGLEFTQSLTNLNASECASLRTVGDLSNLRKLQVLEISYCISLIKIPGLSNLKSLEHLNMMWCESVVILPDLSNLKMLKKLSLSKWPNLLEVGGLGGLVYVEHVDMSWCGSIERLPGLSKLQMLKRLDLHNCKKLQEIEGIGSLVSLTFLNMMYCESIVRLSDLSNLRMLKKLILSGCRKLHEIEGLGGLVSLEYLDLRGCESMVELPDISNLKKLRTLNVECCMNLHEITGLKDLESLEHLDMNGCSHMKRLPDLSNLGKIKKLDLGYCTLLREIGGLGGLVSLEYLDLKGIESMVELPDISNLKKLRTLKLGRSKYVEGITGLQGVITGGLHEQINR